MTSSGNNFNYFPQNKLTKLANYVRAVETYMLMFCLQNLKGWAPEPWAPFVYATEIVTSGVSCKSSVALYRTVQFIFICLDTAVYQLVQCGLSVD